MIKINKSLEELDKLANDHFQVVNAGPMRIMDKLLHRVASAVAPQEQNFYEFLLANIKDIIVGRPDQLESLRQQIAPLHQAALSFRVMGLNGQAKKDAKRNFKSEILEVFEYARFSSERFAYDLAEKLGVNVCLYCNRQFTFTLKGKRKTRPQFDHFYEKGAHPYFALSFYNLIPSCSICNSSLKGTNKFNYNDNFHPYIDDCENVMFFAINVTAIEFIDGDKKAFEIILKPFSAAPSTAYQRAMRNADIFAIEDLYNMHKEYVVELIKKAYYYDDEKIDQLFNFETSNENRLFGTREEVVEFIIGSYVRTEKLGDRVLAKLIRDIASQLGLLKTIGIQDFAS